MSIDLKSILKFIFPEYQVVVSVKQYGFLAKRQKVQKSSFQAQDQVQSTIVAKGTKMKSSEIKTNRNESTQNQNETQVPPYTYKDKVKFSSSSVSETFETIRNDLSNTLIGQKNYFDSLCVAFKRPFITGYEKQKPKNNIFIIGKKSSGRNESIKVMLELMKQKKLVSDANSSNMDLSLYPTPTEQVLFLSDLYKALYGQSDVIVFKNFEKSHSSVIEIISTLALEGRYKLSTRYSMQNNNLIEATGVLMQNSISEISANEKYFVYISECNEQKIDDIFGSKFMNSIGDIIKTDDYSNEEIVAISRELLKKFTLKCQNNLSINPLIENGVSQLCAEKYKISTGLKGIEMFIEKEIFKPLSEYKLRNNLSQNIQINLSVDHSEIIAEIGENSINLSTVFPKKYVSQIDDVKKELNTVIGLDKVKEYVLNLEDNLKIQQMREDAGYKVASISKHMTFTGNPGTGKTTIARIVAKYLKALGVLSVGQLREVSRADLVGQYVGHTARLTNDVIKSALGGVLFVDEAYALCRDKHDTFGLEAIDALVKGIEDNRDDLVVILAGYKGEMDEFLKINPGLKSRFPNQIDFEDYTPTEMYDIALITAKSKGYKILGNCQEGLIRLFEKSQIRGRNDSGNGRFVRNVIESAILNQSKRLLRNISSEEMDVLEIEDFNFENFSKFDLEENFSKIIGLENVKDFVRTQNKLLIATEKRRNAGIVIDSTQSLNMIFSGNPGTGKTTIARVVASMFKEMGLLKSGHLVETDRGGLVAEYVGQTAKKTEDIFRSALGGVLFIDEAYSLASDGSSFGKEAIDTLVKLIEDYRGEIVVILAGYKKEMSEFMKSNSGLESRFPLIIEFPDYTKEELYQIALKMIDNKGFVVDESAKYILSEQIEQLHKTSNAYSGNGRMVRNFIEKIMRNQSARIALIDVDVKGLTMILGCDIEVIKTKTESYDLEGELAKITGLEEVKGYIRSLNARLKIQSERKKMGLTVDHSQTLHMIFKGNPGTGKTMVARTIAKVLYDIGVIKTDKLIETDRAGLVAGYVGQTAIKTTEKITEAMDGVLFIDEAYALSSGGSNDFGREAIDTLVKMMDDNRDRIVVILAGYSNDMDSFLQVNPGLKSRFPNIIEFADYDVAQLIEISKSFYNSKGYELSSEALEKLSGIFENARKVPAFGNGRYVRNVFEKSINNQSLRLSTDIDLTREELLTVDASDIVGE